ncbi:hypothetical protein LTR64_002026 [Lithohypha guttulata]|uniref:uncharacterized protein n=1 Tax=Lithohypha guttulata TaxID=1690604 RepID=UPI002DDE318C|nr:hypothetical protein LTR51_007885 [Lithohypha guttulata]
MFGNVALFQQGTMQHSEVSLNKRRRFAPDTLPFIVSSEDGATTPLLLEADDRSPSQQEIEAQLLQVGMRVRKSVADGYQNTPGRRAFTPRPFANFNRLSPQTRSALSGGTDADASSAGPQNLSTATFCGINLAMMAHVSSAPAIQEQKLWSYSTASKRRQQFEDDPDSDDSQDFMPRTPQLEYADGEMGPSIPQDYFNILPDNMSNIARSTQSPAPQVVNHNRRLAQPKSRLRAVPQQPVPVINPFAQIAPPRSGLGHQRIRSCGMEAMDFGEASFLQPRQDVDMDCS